ALRQPAQTPPIQTLPSPRQRHEPRASRLGPAGQPAAGHRAGAAATAAGAATAAAVLAGAGARLLGARSPRQRRTGTGLHRRPAGGPRLRQPAWRAGAAAGGDDLHPAALPRAAALLSRLA